jgi:hypothetical protein
MNERNGNLRSPIVLGVTASFSVSVNWATALCWDKADEDIVR